MRGLYLVNVAFPGYSWQREKTSLLTSAPNEDQRVDAVFVDRLKKLCSLNGTDAPSEEKSSLNCFSSFWKMVYS